MSEENFDISNYVDEWNEIPKEAVKPLPRFMTKGGPGDNEFELSLLDGKVDTSAWFVDPLIEEQGDNTGPWNYNPDVLKKGTYAQKAKDQELFFCHIPFTQLYIEMGGHYAACCFGAEADGRNGLPNNTVNNTTLKGWMEDGEYMNNIRNEMLDADSDFEFTKKACKRCIADERRYGRSRRTASIKIASNDSTYWQMIEDEVKMFQMTGQFQMEQRMIEVQLKVYGDECNLDCFMCMHDNSSIRQKVASEGVWSDEVFGSYSWNVPVDTIDKQTGVVKKANMKNFKNGNIDGNNVEDMIEQTMKIAPYIRSIKIIGGEPLIMKKHYELLKRLIAADQAQHIIIKYQTNLTETKAGNHNIFDYIPHFKLVCMVASVDGVGKTIEYMRRRTDWDKVIKNTEYCRRYDNVNVDFNGLVSLLSVMRFYEVIDFCLDNPIIDQINWALLETPINFRINNLPEKIKKGLLPKYELWPDIQAALKLPQDPGADIQEVFDYLLKGDEYYTGTRWESHLFDIFPELEEFYIKPEDRDKKHQKNKKVVAAHIGINKATTFATSDDYV